MHFKIYTLFQNFIIQVTLKHITPIIRHLLASKFFIITCFLLLILIKETKTWNISKIFNIDFLKLNRCPPSLSQILHWCRWLLFPSIKIFWSSKCLKSDVIFFFIEIFKFISLVCKIRNACMGKLIVKSPFVILRYCVSD